MRLEILKKLEDALPNYIKEVKSKNQEAAKAYTFSTFIHDVFGVQSRDMDFEKPVKSEVLQVRGRIDAVFGNIIIEFKRDLKQGLDTAKEELQKYFQAYLENSQTDFIGIANDGINFKVFYPVLNNKIVTDIEEIDSINIENSTPQKVFLWFDSYFFSSHKITPTSEDIKRRFGLDSPTFILLQKKLEVLFQKVESYKPAVLKYENWNKYLEIVYGNLPNDKSLFFKHTYLSTLVKMIIHVKISGNRPSTYDDIKFIILGSTFTQAGIKNFMEEDFYAWITSKPINDESNKIFYKLLQEMYVYDLEKINEDVLKELYQELVDSDVRKLLGEFYTPDWLAESMVENVLSEDPTKSIMDPSCGSGTFLFKIIQYKIKRLTEKNWSSNDILNHIIKNVIGFDIHPLAVIISKTNYLLALKDILKSRNGQISMPVYLSDTIKNPAKNTDVSISVQTFRLDAADKKFRLPVSVVQDISRMDDVINMLKEYGRDLELEIEKSLEYNRNFDVHKYIENRVISFSKFLKTNYDETEGILLIECLRSLYELIINDADGIWPYILRNIYKPVSVSIKKVDIIIGNPPWLTMQGMKNDEYKKFLKHGTIKFDLLDKKQVHQFPHIELATLFCKITVKQYLAKNGKLAFVMPKSILVSSHHTNFRKFKNPNMKLELIYDIENVKPLFNVPTCSIFCTNNDITNYPVKKIMMSGKLPTKNVNLERAKKYLNFSTSTYEPINIDMKRSEYHTKFYQGATIVPRNFFFIQPKISSSLLGVNLESPTITSNSENMTKLPWSNITITGEVESKFLFGSILGSNLIPFGILEFKMITLPIKIIGGKPSLYKNHVEIQLDGFPKASQYFEEVEELWNKNKTTSQKNTTIYDWINYRNKISEQNLKKKYKVLYTASSTYLTACVINQTEKMYYKSTSIKIELNGFIAESKTYYFETDDANEAYYLCAILNSKIIDELIKPLQTRGLWGPRDIHKRPLLIPIPIYNHNNLNHKKLSKLSQICHKCVLEYNKSNNRSIGIMRNKIRIMLQDKMNEINTITKNILIDEEPDIVKIIDNLD